MKFQELKKSLNDGLKNIYLIEGEEAFFRERSIKILEDKYVSMRELNFSTIDGQELKGDLSKLISSISAYPFMSDYRLVVLKEYYPTQSEIKDKSLVDYFNNPCATTILAITNSQKSDSLKKLNNVCVVDCSRGDEALLSSWIRSEAQKSGEVVTTDAINKLIDYCLGDLTRIDSELKKLICFKLDDKVIDGEAVDQIVNKDTDIKLYELAQYIADKNKSKAFATINELLEKNNDEQKLLVSIYYHFRRLLYCAVSDDSDSELASYLGVKEFAIKKSRVQAKKFKTKRLLEITDILGESDRAFKSGNLNVNDALWNVVLKII